LKNFLKILVPSCQLQLSLFLVTFFSILCGFLLSDFNFTLSGFFEQNKDFWLISFLPLQVALWLSLGFFTLGNLLQAFTKSDQNSTSELDFKQSSLIIILTWLLAIFTSSLTYLVFTYASGLDLGRHWLDIFADGFFESTSAFSTVGASTFRSSEVFSNSFSVWRLSTQWLGGMGIAYFTFTVWRGFSLTRDNLISSEMETTHILKFKNQNQAIQSGLNFLKAYTILTLVLFTLLLISGHWFRSTSYSHFKDNILDSFIYATSTIATGGFANYASSVQGLQNPTSEWIIAVFMLFSGINFSLWYTLFFNSKQRFKPFLKSLELKLFLGLTLFLTAFIFIDLQQHNFYSSPVDTLRYSFFNVATIISTTGLSNYDFSTWPSISKSLLLLVYFTGGSVGSTSGGVKLGRFIIFFKYTRIKISQFLKGCYQKIEFTYDGVFYQENTILIIILSILVYFLIFLVGGILIMGFSGADFTSSFNSCMAVLGNIGPTVVTGDINTGPSGNYADFSWFIKLFMAGLMLIGRLGITTFLVIFVNSNKTKI